VSPSSKHLVVVLALLASACDAEDEALHVARPSPRPHATQASPHAPLAPPQEVEEARRAEAARAQAETPRFGAEREHCVLGAPRYTSEPMEGASVIAIATGEETERYVLAIERGNTTELIHVRDEATSRVERMPFEALPGEPSSLFAFEAVGPDHFVLLRSQACVAEGETRQCLDAHAVWFDGRLRRTTGAEGARIVMPNQPHTMRLFASDDRLLLARTHDGVSSARVALDTFLFDDTEAGGIRPSTRLLGEGTTPESALEILGVTGTSSSYAVLYRDGAQEAESSFVVMSTAIDEHAIPELREALTIESIALFAGGLNVIASLEFSAPTWLRFGLDGEVVGEPRALAPGEDVPAPFGARRSARLDDATPPRIQVRDAAGHETMRALALPEPVAAADIARIPGGFLIASLEEGRAVVRALSCTPVEAPAAPSEAPTAPTEGR
jgi:hypothetical protein